MITAMTSPERNPETPFYGVNISVSLSLTSDEIIETFFRGDYHPENVGLVIENLTEAVAGGDASNADDSLGFGDIVRGLLLGDLDTRRQVAWRLANCPVVDGIAVDASSDREFFTAGQKYAAEQLSMPLEQVDPESAVVMVRVQT